MGKEILTDYNYFLISPEGLFEKKPVCNLYIEKWLQIRGEINKEDLVKFVEKDPTLLTKWWRTRNLLAVYGTVKDFRLESGIREEIVILYLKDIKIKESR
jgi:hypothetical protein